MNVLTTQRNVFIYFLRLCVYVLVHNQVENLFYLLFNKILTVNTNCLNKLIQKIRRGVSVLIVHFFL